MSIEKNFDQVRQGIRESAIRAGRDPDSIRLIAVTKYSTVDQMNEALRCGATDIGENRVQDGQRKFPLLKTDVTKHFIGTLQTNKVKTALELFDLIQSVDRPELVIELAKQASRLERQVEILIQVNISGEQTKHGISPPEVGALLEQIRRYPSLIPAGLMTIAPAVGEPELTRPVFRSLRELHQKMGQTFSLGTEWRFLSMGMSQDYQVAIEEGANLIRIGTALFQD